MSHTKEETVTFPPTPAPAPTLAHAPAPDQALNTDGQRSREQTSAESVAEHAPYPSGQIALMQAAGLPKVETKYAIQRISVYKVDHLQDMFPDLKRYPNTFQRTKLGRDSQVGIKYNKVIQDDEVVLLEIVRNSHAAVSANSFTRAGPRAYTVFTPTKVNAAIVTCGGLCPGLNDVIRDIFHTLYYNYGVDNIYGIQSGYRGFWDSKYQPWKKLTPDIAAKLGAVGGTYLGSSRGGFHLKKIADSLELYGINQLFVIGGDGTHRAANDLFQEVKRRGIKVCIAGIPKTIDNDIAVIDRSFGFNTAVTYAVEAIKSVKTEAECSPNGIGIVQLMGRYAGYISSHACLASGNVDLCLIPEVPVKLDGPDGVLSHIHNVVTRKGHCVIVVAEGVGDVLLNQYGTVTDESGNSRKTMEIGVFLKERCEEYLQERGIKAAVKYNNPAYMIRSPPAMAADRIYCLALAQNAVHGAMAGYTNFTSGLVNNRSVMIPIPVITSSSPSYLNPFGRTWERVVSTTHQPNELSRITQPKESIAKKAKAKDAAPRARM